MSKVYKKNHVIHETFSYGVVYVYSIPDSHHKGRLKIGSATLLSQNPIQLEIDDVAHERIKKQTKTADVPYILEHAELAVTKNGSYFSDYDVHEILKRSGYVRKSENTKNAHSEWFEIGIDIAINAIQAAKEGRRSLSTAERIGSTQTEFPFRPNQLDAIDKTSRAIKQNRKHFLWNAKMRFGKTSAAMQVAKENEMKKVLIVTHRPSVSADWFDDFNKVFAGTNYQYASKTKGEHISTLVNGSKPFIYFASLQDLRLSKRVVSDDLSNSQAAGFDKNDEVFDTQWDMLIVDEAHEGTQSNLGDVTFSKIPTNFTLQLSGTPFNILHKHEENEIYTWDYVMEQEEKLHWDERHPGAPNPYTELPALSMFTYDIDKFSNHIGNLESFVDALDGAFKFHEFFRVHKDDEGNDMAEFVHEPMVKKFLDLLVDNAVQTKFPYSTEEYRSHNKHSLWLLPNRVKVIEAMEKVLKEHQIFGSNEFGIVNISGNSRDDEEDKDAKNRVTKAINNHEYTITLTGQRLTTGASIPQWTAVFMMSDTSSATTYLQTAFRCQTPAKIDGKLKTQGYVFDFAPDRTLRLVAEAIELNHKSGKTNTPEQRQAVADFLNFCPILASDGGTMKPYDVGGMLKQLKKAIIERVSRNGFDDPKLYNDELLQLDELEIGKFNDLRAIVGTSTSEKTNEITVNELGMDQLEAQKAEEAERKKKQKKDLTNEEKEALNKLKEAREQKKSAISILRAVSIRMPMLVYGADISVREDMTLKKFIDIVDDESWQEFMPAGLTKDTFREFTKYYDEEVFQGVAHSIRAKTFDYDEVPPTERVQAIAEIFSTFKNPDKETVLTPWNVVNMQMSLTLGGHDFRTIIREKPEWKTAGLATNIWSQDDSTILEINSKSGLYPLLAAYNLYSRQLIKQKKPEDKIHKHLWHNILERNIFIICKSPMAKTITERTLAGYSKTKMNVVYINDLIKKQRQEDGYSSYNFSKELRDKFGLKGDIMKFTAVVGNPPYQLDDGGNAASSSPIYNLFVDSAKQLSTDYISLIMPSRWFAGGKGLDGFRASMLSDDRIESLTDYVNSKEVFPGVSIGGGVCYFLWNANYHGKCNFTNILNHKADSMARDLDQFPVFVRYNKALSIIEKVVAHNEQSIVSQISNRNPFGLPTSARGKADKTLKHLTLYTSQGVSFISPSAVTINNHLVSKYKVMISRTTSEHAGEPDKQGMVKVISKIGVLKPNEVCSDTYIVSDGFSTEAEAINFMTYLKTRFARLLLLQAVTSINITKNKFYFLPEQDFKQNWNDEKLYKKYGLTNQEVDFIETRVKAME